MNRRFSLVMAVAIVAAMLLAGALPVSSQAVRYEVSSTETVCLIDPGTNWTGGNVLHLRDVVHVNVDVSDDPELNGINTTYADADINLKNGNVTIQGTLSWQPEGIDGSWEGTWTFIANNGIVRAQGEAQGIGALKGKMFFMEVFDAEPDPDGQLICDQVGGFYDGTENVVGYVLETGAY